MRAWLALVLLAGCNQVFGLDETIGPAPLDSDRDGIPDEDDNCVLAGNLDQANADEDTFGDACDPCPQGPQSGIDEDKDGVDDTCDACPRGPNHDEDGDALLDGCDNCPGTANADQLDGDADEVGDVCDRNPGAPDQRTFFEAFAPPDASWNTGFSTWTATGEGYAPKTIVMGPGPWNPRAAVQGTSWQVTTLMRLPAMPDGSSVGISTVQTSGQSVLSPYCAIERVSDRWESAGNGMTVPVTDPLRITLMVVEVDALTIETRCWIGDHELVHSTYPAQTFYPVLYVTSGVPEYLYLDVVQ